MRIDVQADQDIRPLLAGQSLAQVRLALALALEQAQWGVLNARGAVYTSALRQADEVLAGYFDAANPAVQSLRQRIEALAEQPVEVETPELRPALLSLQAYVQQRQTPRNGETEQEAAP
ncbi:bifunctional uroporphyrinogen-III synthetase/uroporphyrin-III C-methyltransferase [compost metagenome]